MKSLKVVFDNRTELIHGCIPLNGYRRLKDDEIAEFKSEDTISFNNYEVHFKGEFYIDYTLKFNNCKVIFDGKIECEKDIKFNNCEIIFGEVPSTMYQNDVNHCWYIRQYFDKKISVEFIECSIYQEDFNAKEQKIFPNIELYDGDISFINCKIENVVELVSIRDSSLVYIDGCEFNRCKGTLLNNGEVNPDGEIIIKNSMFREIKFIEKTNLFRIAFFSCKEKIIYLNGSYNSISNCIFENCYEPIITTSDDGYTIIENCRFNSCICEDGEGRNPLVETYGDVDIIDCEFDDEDNDINKKEGELAITKLDL